MTKLLQEAFTTVSTSLSRDAQDRLAQLMIRNVNRLEAILEDELDEQVFESSAIRAVESDKVQALLKRVAARHDSTNRPATHSR
jgi:hypothetical protein